MEVLEVKFLRRKSNEEFGGTNLLSFPSTSSLTSLVPHLSESLFTDKMKVSYIKGNHGFFLNTPYCFHQTEKLTIYHRHAFSIVKVLQFPTTTTAEAGHSC